MRLRESSEFMVVRLCLWLLADGRIAVRRGGAAEKARVDVADQRLEVACVSAARRAIST